MSAFSNNLRIIRKNNMWSQDQAAAFYEANRSTYGAWEDGRSHPNYVKLCDIADRLEMTLDALLGRKPVGKKQVQSPFVIKYNTAPFHVKKAIDILLDI